MRVFSNRRTYLADLYSQKSGYYDSLIQFLREEPKSEEPSIQSIANTIERHWYDLSEEVDTEVFLFNDFISYCLSEVNWEELAQKVKENVV